MSKSLPNIDARLVLRSEGHVLVSRERIALLEAVVKHGNITKAAKVAGFSYKMAWDSVHAVNTLLPHPAFVAKSGGSPGGSTTVTEEGLRLIATFRQLEEALGRLSTWTARGGHEGSEDRISPGADRRLSSRNAFSCRIVEINPAPVNIEIKLEVTPDVFICALVAKRTVSDLSLIAGGSVMAIINDMSVMLVSGAMARRITGRNKIGGDVVFRVDSGETSEITLDIGHGKVLEAAVAQNTADEVGAQLGTQVYAVFSTAHVLLAAD